MPSTKSFQKVIWNYYQQNRRDFPWRNTTNPYRIVVSEIMLQQTQADRVVPKYLAFIKHFPTFKALAEASLTDVLKQWQGLGYNRRGRYLKELAQVVTEKYKGKLPTNPELLEKLPGIGKATARSIAAFAFNQPVTFIETNIRSVFIHHFFPNKENVTDTELLPLVEKTVDQTNPREWYFALMDYGVMLKKTKPNPSRQSKHHVKQSRFKGSNRELRGQIIRLLTTKKKISRTALYRQLTQPPQKVDLIIDTLIADKLVTRIGKTITIA